MCAEKKPAKETGVIDDNDSEYNDDDDEDDDDDEISLPSIKQTPEIMEELDSLNTRIEDRKHNFGIRIAVEMAKSKLNTFPFSFLRQFVVALAQAEAKALAVIYEYTPILLVLSVLLIVLALGARILSMLMHRRGERYRQALLASKGSIIYQKLSEEINTPQTPKIHRYAPINQV